MSELKISHKQALSLLEMVLEASAKKDEKIEQLEKVNDNYSKLITKNATEAEKLRVYCDGVKKDLLKAHNQIDSDQRHLNEYRLEASAREKKERQIDAALSAVSVLRSAITRWITTERMSEESARKVLDETSRFSGLDSH